MTTMSRRPPAKAKAKGKAKAKAPAERKAPAQSKRTPAKRTPADSGAGKLRPTPGATTTKSATKSTTKSPVERTAAKSTAAKSTAAKSTTTKGTAAKGTAAKGTKAVVSRPVAARGVRAAPRTPFVLLIVGLLGGALVSLLLLNTVLAKDAFTLTRLQQSNKRLEQQRQSYEEEIARGSSPVGLSQKAKALGMKQAEEPAFFNPSTGRAGGGQIRPVPPAAAAAAGAAAVVGVPGTVVPGDGVPPAATGGTGQAGQTGQAGRGAP